MAHKPETPSAPMTREELEKKLAADPRFVEAKTPPRQGYVILGARKDKG
jgi:hypothetical protein